MLRFLNAHWHFTENVNGYAPFFNRKSLDNSNSCFSKWTAMLRFRCDLGIKNTTLATGERQCSVFSGFFGFFGDIERICSVFQAVFKPIFDSKVGGLNRSEWVGMLRFRHSTTISNTEKDVTKAFEVTYLYFSTPFAFSIHLGQANILYVSWLLP